MQLVTNLRCKVLDEAEELKGAGVGRVGQPESGASACLSLALGKNYKFWSLNSKSSPSACKHN
jgi:hypothetical protein